MNNIPQTPRPEKPAWEELMEQTARDFPYPPTPDMAGRLRGRLKQRRGAVRMRLARGAVLAVLMGLAVMLVVPEVRAAVLEFIRIGAVRIFLIEASPSPSPSAEASVTRSPRPTQTPYPTRMLLQSVLELPGETRLATAQSAFGNRIQLPAYPVDLGQPDRVFLQSTVQGPLVTLVWMEGDAPERVRMSLEVLTEWVLTSKMYPAEAERQRLEINGMEAVWLGSPHEIWYSLDRFDFSRWVSRPVLVWQAGEGAALTYRLEADLPLEEAIKVAESLEAAD